MTEIESSLGKTASSPRGRSARILTVEDENEPQKTKSFGNNWSPKMSEKEQKELERHRAEAIEKKERISPEAKERIEFLTGLGRITGSATVDEIEFTFQSLKGIEQNAVFEALSEFGEMNALKMQYEIRFQTLARALTHIQGKLFSDVIESNDINDKLILIRELDENISDHLYKWYHKNIVSVGQDKYAIKTTKDVEEVAEAIKKS